MRLTDKLKGRPKSIRFIVCYAAFMVILLSALQIIYVLEIVPLYLKALNNYDPFSGSSSDLNSVTTQVGTPLKFIAGFSSGLVATVVEIALISALRLNKPYRQRSYVNFIACSIFSFLLALAYILAIFLGRQDLNAQNLGSILSFFALIPLFFYLGRPVVRQWSKQKEVDFPNVDLSK